MAAGRMPAYQHGFTEPRPQKNAGAANLFDDVTDGDDRTEIVADDGDGNAVLVEAARHLAGKRRIERPPVTAVNEEREWSAFARFRQEQIDDLPRRITVGETKLGAADLERFGAVELGLARPARKNLVAIRHARARTILALQIGGGHRYLQLFGARLCGKGVARASRAT